MKKSFVIGGIILIIAFLGMGFLFHSDCKKDCDKQPAYWYSIPVRQVYYSSFYHTSNTGVPIDSSEEEEAPHTDPAQPEEEEAPHTGPAQPEEAPPPAEEPPGE